MIKRFFSLLAILGIMSNAFAADYKVAIVDVQKVVSNSAQVKALTKEQEAKKKEITQLLKKADEELKKETDLAKKKAIAQKYEKQINTKREANAKAYKTKLDSIDKSITATITQQAQAMGYNLVLTKGVVLYGGIDITDAILKVVK